MPITAVAATSVGDRLSVAGGVEGRNGVTAVAGGIMDGSGGRRETTAVALLPAAGGSQTRTAVAAAGTLLTAAGGRETRTAVAEAGTLLTAAGAAGAVGAAGAPEPLGGRAAERLCDTNFSFELQRIKSINTQENHTLS